MRPPARPPDHAHPCPKRRDSAVRKPGRLEGDDQECLDLGLDYQVNRFVCFCGALQQASEGAFDLAMKEHTANGIAELAQLLLPLDTEGSSALAGGRKSRLEEVLVGEVEVSA